MKALAVAVLMALVSMPLRQEHGVLYVQARINGVGPMLFTLDPGGPEVYTNYAKDRLKGRTPKTVCLSTACYPAAMQYYNGAPKDLDPKHDPQTGVIAGNIGAALLRNYVARIDYRNSRLIVIREADFRAPAQDRLPLSFDSYGLPVAGATVDGVTAPFEIDVRAPTSMLFRPFLDRTKLGSSYAAAPVVKRSAMLSAHAVRAVRISGYELHDVPFWFSTATSGKFANSDVAGLLGNNVLSHFVLTLDVPHRSAYLSREPHGGTRPM